MAKKKEELISTEGQLMIQERDIEDIKDTLKEIKASIEDLKGKFLTKEEYRERGKILEHLEQDCKDIAMSTKGEVKRIDETLGKITDEQITIKVWLKAIVLVLGLIWPIIMLLVSAWVNSHIFK